MLNLLQVRDRNFEPTADARLNLKLATDSQLPATRELRQNVMLKGSDIAVA